MGTVADYLAGVDGEDHLALERVYRITRSAVPEVEEGTSYGMAALLYDGKGLIATLKSKKFLSLYPFSGKVIAGLADSLGDFERTTGSIHYSASHQIPEELLLKIVLARKAEIDAR